MGSTLIERQASASPAAAVAPDYEDFFENGAVGLHLVDTSGIIVPANKAKLALMGHAADEYVGSHRRLSRRC